MLRERRDRPLPLIGLALVGVAGLVLLSRVSIWPRGDAAWVLLLIAGAIVLWLTHRQPADAPADASKEKPAVEPRPSRWRWPRRIATGLGTAVGVILAFLVVAAAIFHVHVGNGIGDRTYDVRTLGELRPDYKPGLRALSSR